MWTPPAAASGPRQQYDAALQEMLRKPADLEVLFKFATVAGQTGDLQIGPDAQLVIDKFVYDPNTKTGDLAITATKGVFRLVGGKISKTNPIDRKSTRLNSSHSQISYAVFCL